MQAYIKNPKIVVSLCENSVIQINYPDFIEVEKLPGMVDKSLIAIADRILREDKSLIAIADEILTESYGSRE